MNKKNVLTLIIALITIVVIILIIINKTSNKIIYSEYLTSQGINPNTETIEIFENGVIIREMEVRDYKTELKKKLTKDELKELKELIKNVEESDFIWKSHSDNFTSSTTRINLNKNIEISNKDKYCDNEEVSELTRLRNELYEKYSYKNNKED